MARAVEGRAVSAAQFSPPASSSRSSIRTGVLATRFDHCEIRNMQ